MSPAKHDMIKAIITNTKLSEEEKSKIIAEIMDEFDKNYPDLKYHATKSDIKEIELKLTKEIEETRKEIKEIELKLSKEIEQTRKEIKEVELKLSKEIEQTRKEIKEIEGKLQKEIKEVDAKLQKEIKEVELKLSKEIQEIKSNLLKWSFTFWISQISVILGIGFFIIKSLH